jgi:hypothetical protein
MMTRRGMLLFPFGNLSHTSILYYVELCAKVEYDFSKEWIEKEEFLQK